MQLRLYFNCPNPLKLPLSYNHILQGFIYDTLRVEPDYSAFLHDHGYTDEGRPFRLFVFSLISGKYKIEAPYIIFEGDISFELRSPVDAFCDIFYLAFMHKEKYILCGQELELQGCVSSKRTITESSVRVHTLSPICVHQTYMEGESKKTRYIRPQDEDFSGAVNSNFLTKYRAAYGSEADNILITPVKVDNKDKFVTKFEGNIYITAWNGVYELKGSPDDLDFLYNCGVGGKNSQGFGMVERI